MPERIGDFILTYSGIEFYPLDPRPEEISLRDIAHALSHQCRYSGHTRWFYSVAEHSLRVAEAVPQEWKLLALLHDAAEAYLVDLPMPIKRHSELGLHYMEAEQRLLAAICNRFALTWEYPLPEPIERADKAMLWVESQALMPRHAAWKKWKALTTGMERELISPMFPANAKFEFIKAFFNYGGRE